MRQWQSAGHAPVRLCASPAAPIPPLHVGAVAAAEAFLRRTRPTPSGVHVNLVSAVVLPPTEAPHPSCIPPLRRATCYASDLRGSVASDESRIEPMGRQPGHAHPRTANRRLPFSPPTTSP